MNVTTDAPAPVQQQSFSSQYLKQVQFRNPDHRIEVLSRLPDVISGATGDQELFVRLVSMLLAGVPRADAAAVVAVEAADAEDEERRDGSTTDTEEQPSATDAAHPSPPPVPIRTSSPVHRPAAPRAALGPAAGDHHRLSARARG